MTFLKRLWQWLTRRQDNEPETSEGIPYNYNSVLDIWHTKTN